MLNIRVGDNSGNRQLIVIRLSSYLRDSNIKKV